MLEKQKANVKETWKILNEITNKRENKPTYAEYFIKSKKRISQKEDIGNGFNNFLTHFGPNLANNIPLPKNDTTIYDYLEEIIKHTMFLSPVDDLEIIRTVQNYKNKRSTDFSDISISLLKKVISKIVKPFAHICNVSFQTGVFPNKMKIAKVIPLYISLDKKTFLQITGQYLYYHNSQKFWRNYITTDWTCSLVNVTYSVQVSMGLDLACQQLRLF